MSRGRGTRGGGSGSRGGNQPPRERLTHFLCLPLVTGASRPQLEASIARFRAEVDQLNQTATAPAVVPSTAIRPLDTLHLTLGVMSLVEPGKLQEAISLLETLDVAKMLADCPSTSSQNDNSELTITLESLAPMRRPNDTSVLFAIPKDSTSRLMPFCEALQKSFMNRGFIVNENRPLKLHATVINTVFSKKEVGTVKGLDATQLLAQFQDFQWTGGYRVEKIAICEMGAKKTFERGVLVKEAYTEVASVGLP
ncbi:hypothetical protein BT63DRAFT_456261 [Microthyrium microscopicum]|uniref:A-kinase anchor protein 7-like phosphoesterase domain-containing protein n=1 Tax=Microthyrium microscopicum TaxID=703497 RepID=A0A6A6UBY8_9PEZI|nr:hypothetical protein BT63DRAFT_456261 [Microthyrium microscopicum]